MARRSVSRYVHLINSVFLQGSTVLVLLQPSYDITVWFEAVGSGELLLWLSPEGTSNRQFLVGCMKWNLSKQASPFTPIFLYCWLYLAIESSSQCMFWNFCETQRMVYFSPHDFCRSFWWKQRVWEGGSTHKVVQLQMARPATGILWERETTSQKCQFCSRGL